MKRTAKWNSRFRLALGSKMKPKTGGANRDRTGDLLLAKQALSQLSYGPKDRPCFRCLLRKRGLSLILGQLVGLGGLEPPTPRLSSVCSNQLSYRPVSAGHVNAQPISVGARAWGISLERR